jgi:hypothetical protein
MAPFSPPQCSLGLQYGDPNSVISCKPRLRTFAAGWRISASIPTNRRHRYNANAAPSAGFDQPHRIAHADVCRNPGATFRQGKLR